MTNQPTCACGCGRAVKRRWAQGHNPKLFNGQLAAVRCAKWRERWPARSKAALEKHRQKKYALIAELKARPCVDCGGCFPPVCMDFDHVRGTKFKDLADMRTHTRERVLAETAKCDLVCANCHRIRTLARRRVATAA